MKSPALKLCLATVTTEAFVPGTLVMLHSFLKVNPWFEGDLVIIHDGLEPTAHQSLVACFERLRLPQCFSSSEGAILVKINCAALRLLVS